MGKSAENFLQQNLANFKKIRNMYLAKLEEGAARYTPAKSERISRNS